jgi:diguanylate cyclase (GGDEF)-like protein
MTLALQIAPGSSNRIVLQSTLWGVFVVHAAIILCFHNPAVASNLCTAGVGFIAAFCCLWRSARLDSQERPPWLWIAVGFLIWSVAQVVFTHVAGTNWDFGPGPDISDLLFFDALIPLFLAISNTYETQAATSVIYLNIFQAVMATALTYVSVFKVDAPAAMVKANLYDLYWYECLLLAIASTFRLLTWSTPEERLRSRLLCAMLWMYLPNWRPRSFMIFGLPWGLPKGTLLELLWSVSFLFLGWQALRSPIRKTTRRLANSNPRAQLLRSLFPLMITVAIFGLAVSVGRHYFYLGLGAILLLLLAQGIHSGVIQVGYLQSQSRLLNQEKELTALNAELEKQSMLDPLTGIPNRRYFSQAFESEWKRAARKDESLALLMLDVDYFKAVNDYHGHLYGDECLVRMADALSNAVQRGVDIICRYGGEEFIVVLPDTDLEGAETVAASLQSTIAKLRIQNKQSPFDELLTVSIGIAVMSPAISGSPSELIARADHALYRAKNEGRNRICCAEDSVACEGRSGT